MAGHSLYRYNRLSQYEDFLKGVASGKQSEPICVAIETFKMIKLSFFTTESIKLPEVALKYSEPHISESLHLNRQKNSHCKNFWLRAYESMLWEHNTDIIDCLVYLGLIKMFPKGTSEMT